MFIYIVCISIYFSVGGSFIYRIENNIYKNKISFEAVYLLLLFLKIKLSISFSFLHFVLFEKINNNNNNNNNNIWNYY
jgi:hypothetical protein